MKIGVFGSSGMLGGYVLEYLKRKNFSVVELKREDVITEENSLSELLTKKIGSGWVINCVGVIKPQIAIQGSAEAIRVNGMFPHVLANAGKKTGTNVLHITTDCVFSGKTGGYTEDSPHDEQDMYGRSKSIGEPTNCQVVRTSIIGEERVHKRSLIEWAKGEAGKEVRGFTNHTWNGVTCLEFAKIAEKIINGGPSWEGVRHVHSPRKVNKQELLTLISDAFSLNLKIAAFETENPVFRDLSSKYPPAIDVPDLKEQLQELVGFYR